MAEALPNTLGRGDERSPISGGLRWTLLFSLFLLLYVVSAGVTEKLYYQGAISNPTTVYRPLIWLAHNCPPFGAFMSWFVFTVWRVPHQWD
jgi:hypothetical protein